MRSSPGKSAKGKSPKKDAAPASSPAKQQAVRRPPQQQDDGSRKLAALGYGLLVLLATAVMSVEHKGPQGRRFVQFSPVEVTSMFITEQAPALKPLARALHLPGTMLKRASITLKYCYGKKVEQCNFKPVMDLPHMMEEADVEDLIPIMREVFSPSSWNLLVGGSLVVVFTALVGMVRKPVRMGVLGFALIVYAVYITQDADFLPNLLFEGFLGGYVLFYDPIGMAQQRQDDRRKAADKLAKLRGQQQAQQARPGTANGTHPKAGQSPADRKKAYDI